MVVSAPAHCKSMITQDTKFLESNRTHEVAESSSPDSIKKVDNPAPAGYNLRVRNGVSGDLLTMRKKKFAFGKLP